MRGDLCYDRVHTRHITILTSSLPPSSVSVLKAVSVVSFLAADWSHDASTGLWLADASSGDDHTGGTHHWLWSLALSAPRICKDGELSSEKIGAVISCATWHNNLHTLFWELSSAELAWPGAHSCPSSRLIYWIILSNHWIMIVLSRMTMFQNVTIVFKRLKDINSWYIHVLHF